jgi:hypothetical protein
MSEAIDCAAIKPGDLVWLQFRRLGEWARHHAKVFRLTPTQIVVYCLGVEHRFHRTGGSGVSSLDVRIVGIASAEDVADFDRAQERLRARKALLDREHIGLKKLLGRRGKQDIDLRLNGDRYELHFFQISAVLVKKLISASKGKK